METKIIKISESAVESASAVLNRGGLVVFPTDTVYGLAAKIMDATAIEEIYMVKGRDETKSIPVLLGDQSQLNLVTENISDIVRYLLSKLWPGGLTAVVRKKTNLPKSLSVNDTVGVRIPDHDFVRKLACRVGPLAATSANLSGLDPAIDAEMAYAQLKGKVDLIVDGGVCLGGVPSTVIDCTNKAFTILRHGAVSEEKILEVINQFKPNSH